MIKIKHYINHKRTLQELSIKKDFISWFNVWPKEEKRTDEVNKIDIPAYTRIALYYYWWDIILRVSDKELKKFLSNF